MPSVEEIYVAVQGACRRCRHAATPYGRRILRLIALPYLYAGIDWRACQVPRLRVIKDFLYIFFVLKDFPDSYVGLQLWKKPRTDWPYYYGSIYNPHQRGRLRREVQKKEYEIIFEDKGICHQLCQIANIPVPAMLGRAETTVDFRTTVEQLFNDEGETKIIVKPLRGRKGGGIFLAHMADGHIVLTDGRTQTPLQRFQLATPVVIQRYQMQHPALARIARSVNTVRVETLLTRSNEVLLLGAFIRFGLGESIVDNKCAGGLSAGVDLGTGRLNEVAMDKNGCVYERHPDSGVSFKDIQVPHWSAILDLAQNVQKHFSYYRLLGLDIGIAPSGPVIIEINGAPDHAGLERDSGPVFRNRAIWEEFKRYDLLINTPCRRLYTEPANIELASEETA